MNIVDALLDEFALEVPTTRRVLERVPEAHFDWKPHAKSMTLGALASHLAEIPQWTRPMLELDEFVFDPLTYKPWLAKSRAELLAKCDEVSADAKKVLTGYPVENLGRLWRMKAGDHVLFETPRLTILRRMFFNHIVHHRGQLTVYLRLLDVPVPSIYGRSADEQPA